MSRKREILELLTADELRGLVDRFELEEKDRRARDGMIDTLSRSHRAQLAEPLGEYPRDRLKELCRKLDLEDGGKEKAPIVERLLGRAPEPVESDDEPVAVFCKIDEAANRRLHASEEESLVLAELRDLLLPRLLSGELRICDAERAVEAAL